MQTVLVTGATGNVGRHVVRELQQRGVSVRALVRDTAKAAWMLGDGVELVGGDFGDRESVRRALAGVESVFLACANDARQVEYETGVIDAAAATGVGRIVKLSALGAQRGSPVVFWDWHGQIEAQLRETDVPAVVLQPSFMMSNLLGSVEQIRQLGSLFLPAAGARVAMIDPRDIAATAAAALSEDGHTGQTYVLTGPQAISFEQVAEQLSAVAGRRIQYVAVSDAAAQQAMAGSGVPDFVAQQIVAIFECLRRGDQDLATGAVRALIGRPPRGFAGFADEYAEMFRV